MRPLLMFLGVLGPSTRVCSAVSPEVLLASLLLLVISPEVFASPWVLGVC